VIKAAPSVGLAAEVTHHFGIWAEAELAALAYRRDDRAGVSLAPSALGGVSLGL
jgi:hypothetical protein